MRIGGADARRRFSELRDRAIGGEVVEVARRGEVVAVIAPPSIPAPAESVASALHRWRVSWDVESWPDDGPFDGVRDSSVGRGPPRAVVNGYLLDTNVVSELARPAPNPGVLARLAEVEEGCALSSVSWHELGFGIARSPEGRRRDALHAFLADLAARFPILPYDRTAADWHAGEWARLERSGLPRAFADGQLAATAVTNGLRLVTRSLVDFTGFAGLDAESWW